MRHINTITELINGTTLLPQPCIQLSYVGFPWIAAAQPLNNFHPGKNNFIFKVLIRWLQDSIGLKNLVMIHFEHLD